MTRGVIIFLAFFMVIPALPGRGEDGTVKNNIVGKNFLRWKAVEGAAGYAVEIRDDSEKLVLEKRVDAAEYYFSLPPGKYRVRIGAVNRFQQVVSWSDWSSLVIKPPVKPVIDSLEPGQLPPLTKGIVVIRGSKFLPGARVFLARGGKEYLQEKCLRREDDRIECAFTSPPEKEKQVTFIVVNPGGLRDSFSLIIAPPEKKTIAGTEKKGGEIYVSAGYYYVQVLGSWREPLKDSVAGGFLTAGMTPGVFPPLRGYPLLEMVTLECEISYAGFDSHPRDGIVKSSLHQLLMGFFLRFSVPLYPEGLFFEVRGGGGMAWHYLIQNWSIFDGEYSSLYQAMTGAGAGFRYQWGYLSFIAGCDYRLIFTKRRYFHSLGYRCGMAFRF